MSDTIGIVVLHTKKVPGFAYLFDIGLEPKIDTKNSLDKMAIIFGQINYTIVH